MSAEGAGTRRGAAAALRRAPGPGGAAPFRGLGAVAGLLALVALAPPSARAQAQPDVVTASVGSRRAELRVSRHRGFPAVDAGELAARALGEVSQRRAFLRVRLGGRDLFFEAGSPFFVGGTTTHQLTNAPYEWGGAFWLPAEFVTRWLGEGTALAAAAPTPAPESLPDRVDPQKPWRVIIDPGHGGRDPGTIGRRSNEKEVVLAIGKLLHDELRSRPLLEPFLTRDDDVYVKHDLRSQFAVDRAGDLFVSIHANAAENRQAHGFETIFLGPARSEEAREVALRENRGPTVDDESPGSTDELMFILTGLDRTENLAESRRFAGFVQNAIRGVRGGGSPDRGVKQGPWWVLLGALARMPSVIVEVGFLSNDEEERYLTSSSGQRAMARAIADAIVAYRRDLLTRYASSGGGGGED